VNSKKAMRRFMSALAVAPVGARFEVGTMFDPKQGWRVYQRIGDTGLAMSADDARALVRTFENQAAMPERRAAGNELRGMFEELKSCADDCDRKNREKAVPPDLANGTTQWARA
jgi:hypothetical protein